MKKRLTLTLDEALIRRAKDHARERGESVSQLVSEYFSALGASRQIALAELPPSVRALYGALAGRDVEPEDYHRHLEGKYS
ncbi:toxin-antitoxin system protein [Candidatus Poribacteria bacterium]|nr:toxin-antitoxin system protein [Candidatus Poribacteria bacterium]